MNRKKCIEIIEHECIDPDGFLIQLRSLNFSEKNFRILRKALAQYREMVRDDITIERSIAYCLHYLDLELISSTEYFSRDKNEKSLIHKANTEIASLIEEILTPESLFDSIV